MEEKKMGVKVRWSDFTTTYFRLCGKQVYQRGPGLNEMPGHLMALGTFAHAQRAAGAWNGAAYLINLYCEFRGVEEWKFQQEYQDWCVHCWKRWVPLADLVEELSQ